MNEGTEVMDSVHTVSQPQVVENDLGVGDGANVNVV